MTDKILSPDPKLTSDRETVTEVATSGFVTASVLLEYLFCPRFIYFMNCLDIPQHEEKRFKVIKGRDVHSGKERANLDYIRKRIGCIKKEISVYLSVPKYRIHGIIDEVLTLNDGNMVPLDYKYAESPKVVFRTHRFQSIFYALLIRENYGRRVDKGFICYIRSRHTIKEIPIEESDFAMLLQIVEEIIKITDRCYYPGGTKFKTKCLDCCYRNLCV